jgi:predicted Zn-dependent peptidase
MRRKLVILSALVLVVLCLIATSMAAPSTAGGSGVQPTIHSLSNGVRLVIVPFPKSTNVSIFTFVPMSLGSDPPGEAQWSHLVEHLVIRSTFPDDLQRANAETLPDHMRLDFYGHVDDSKEGLSHHRRWLEGTRFTDETLAAEKPKVISECDFTSRNFATHKFALAAWSHASRHSNSHVALKGDVLRATVEDVQRYRDNHFFLPQRTTVCVVGGIDAKSFLAEAAKQLGSLPSRARPAPRVTPRTGNLDVTWDLDARHLLLVWATPDFSDPDFAPLMISAQWLTMQYFSDRQLQTQVGQAFAGTDLATPEGHFFYVSASVRPGASFVEVGNRLRTTLKELSGDKIDSAQLRILGQQLAFSLTQIPDPAMLRQQSPPGMNPALIEGNIGLAFGMNVHRYGPHRETLARNLASVSPSAIQRAAAKYLAANKATLCTISPGSR